eukprot:CAMPEP_0172771182 /NCGR_PEP_ID=MMETSP1074-20121228/190132_1 /TAXON_ID=2916 /ORGANISM="Ceratium fusus, Strain PA161109" /LENGTH=460 /DNA_ID=CAMNT_0013607079 /DNA_START=131 /DNA_END=1511 /DNA_ORIENTATION=+
MASTGLSVLTEKDPQQHKLQLCSIPVTNVRGEHATIPMTSVDRETLQELGQQTLDMLGKYVGHLSELPVRAERKPGELAKQFPSSPPTTPTEFRRILAKVEEHVLPGITHWQHPRFMAYYPSSSSVPAILSETIIAALGVVGLQWSASPIATELEVVVMDWLAKMLGFDGAFLHRSGKGGGILQNTAGEAIANIMVCARVRKQREINPDAAWEEAFYADSSKLVVYMSNQTHFSGPKACRVAGMRVHTIPARLTDGNFRLHPADLQAAINSDRAAGLVPCALQLNFGSTNTCGLDNAAEFEGIAAEERLWVHVDAAYAGPAWALEEFSADAAAVSRVATSVNVNGSKWFLCGFDSAFLWVRDRRLLIDVFAASDDFMAPAEDGIYNPEFKDWSIPLGRRFRALRIWTVIEYFGTDGIRSFLRAAIEQAQWLRDRVDAHPSFAQPVRTRLGMLCIRLAESD